MAMASKQERVQQLSVGNGLVGDFPQMTATEAVRLEERRWYEMRQQKYNWDQWSGIRDWIRDFYKVVLKEPDMLFEVAIIQTKDGKATGEFTVTNIIAKDAEQAKIKALTQTKLALDGCDLTVKVRSF